MNDDNFRKKLNKEEYRILREGGTERPFSGKAIIPDTDGNFHCRACSAPLFSKEAKFESGTGWPSFDEAKKGAVTEKIDRSNGMLRTEILCTKCGSHLGHVFDDGPTKTGKRYCTNSLCFE